MLLWLLLFWLIYTEIVIIYLRRLKFKYLVPKDRTTFLDGKKFKTYQQLKEQYQTRNNINVLVLSGGGVRGMAPLKILAEIEHRTGKKAGELFDFLAGTSTGAISISAFAIADEDGNYKYSAKDIYDGYYEMSKQIFSAPWYHAWLTGFGLFAPRFLPDGKINVLRGYFGDKTISELKGNILIPVYDISQNYLQFVTNWENPSTKQYGNLLAVDLVSGASSPPMLFPPEAVSENGQDKLFIDPAVLLNNPLLPMLLNVRALFPRKKINLVYIGNGGFNSSHFDYRSMFGFGLYGLYQYLFSSPMLSSKLSVEFVEEYMLETEQYDPYIDFFRFSTKSDEDIATSGIDDENLAKIERLANKMLYQHREEIDRLCKVLLNTSNNLQN